MQLQFNLTQESTQQIDPGYCHCGCGEKTSLSHQSDTKRGLVKGQPMRFIQFHQVRVRHAPLIDRFWSRVDKRGPDDCWNWTGAKSVGYGIIDTGRMPDGTKRSRLATHFSYELANGPIPDGLWVLHKCDNPSCVNPAHLFLGTQKDNMEDCQRKGRVRGKPHPGEANSHAKITANDVIRIRELVTQGVPSAQIAAMYGITQGSVRDIVTRTWKHVK